MAEPSIKRFFLAVLAWMVVCFAVWFYLSIVLVTPLAWLVDWVLSHSVPVVAQVLQQGNELEIVTRVAAPVAANPSMAGREAVLAFDINPLIYTFGLPLLVALILAVPGDERLLGKAVIGYVVLLPVHAFSVVMAALKTLTFDLGPNLSQQMASTVWSREAIALGYQLGSLILPAVAPVAVWVLLHRGFIAQLAPALMRPPSAHNS